MQLSINNQPGGIVNIFKDSLVTIHQCNGQQTMQVQTNNRPEPEDIEPVDTSFFCTDRYTPDIIEKNIHQAINLASSKTDACRRILALETYGYIILSNVNDARKAELINPFAAPKYVFTEDDFINARRNKK